LFSLPKTLYSTKSEFSGEIAVIQKGRERQLLVGGHIQSVNWDCPGVEKRVWGKIVESGVSNLSRDAKLPARGWSALGGKVKNQKAKLKILVLGLGAGTEIHLLSHNYPSAQFTAVEIDPEIIKIAKKFFGVGEIPNLEIVNADAFDFLKKSKLRWDLIICDIYAGGHYPKEAESDKFLQTIAKVSKYAIFNRIFDSLQSPDAQEYLSRLKYYFKNVEPMVVHHKAFNILFTCTS
jgi:spermidine synthase